MGKGQYVDDIMLPNMLYMGVVRSTYARAKLIKVSGKDIIDGNELKALRASVGEGAATASNLDLMEPILARDMVYYVGQPVAAVFSGDRYSAEDRIADVEVEYEPLKAFNTVKAAMEGKPIHPGTSSNVLRETVVGNAFDDPKADVVVEDELTNERIMPNPPPVSA